MHQKYTGEDKNGKIRYLL